MSTCFFHRGVLVPGGFGVRGTEGKMLAINWARKQNKPYLGKRPLTTFRPRWFRGIQPIKDKT